MSATTDPAVPVPPVPTPPAPAPTQALTTPGMLDHFFTAVEHGANLIYHRMISVEQDVSAWVVANPIIKPLLDEAVLFAEGVLTAHGIPVTTFISTGQAIMAALGKLAQSDVTVASGPAVPAASAGTKA